MKQAALSTIFTDVRTALGLEHTMIHMVYHRRKNVERTRDTDVIARVTHYPTTKFYLVEIATRNSAREVVLSLLHELKHIEQYESGTLTTEHTAATTLYRWNGHIVPQYARDAPHEVDAEQYAQDNVDQYMKRFS